MLKVSDLRVGYGDLLVLRNVSAEINTGEFVAIVGSNAAGKTTLMRTIAGLLRAKSGQIEFDGAPIAGSPAYAIADRGLSLVLEHGAFRGLTVLESLRLGAYRKAARADADRTLERVFTLFPVLAERRSQQSTVLSGGEQQMLVISRALMSQPKLLLLDEPSVGLSPLMTQTIFLALRSLNAEGLTILLVEQNVAQTLKIVSRAYVLEGGRIVRHAAANELLSDPSIKRAYLGIGATTR